MNVDLPTFSNADLSTYCEVPFSHADLSTFEHVR